MAQQQNPNQKNTGTSKSFDSDTDIGANNPVKKEGSEKRDNRDYDKSDKNLGGQKVRDDKIDMGRGDRSSR